MCFSRIGKQWTAHQACDSYATFEEKNEFTSYDCHFISIKYEDIFSTQLTVTNGNPFPLE